MDRTAKAIENHKNLILTTNSTIASIGLTKAGLKIGGVIVTPAVWALNYTTEGAAPDGFDAGLYAMSFFGSIASVAAIGTGVMKAVVDDDIDRKLREVQAGEDPRYREFIKPCYRYGMMAPQINAATIASKGGTAWKHTNGLWVYITDVRGYLIHDHKPKKAVMTYRPKNPLKKASSGGFIWESIR
jgi:hypothetical protein